LDSDRSVIPRFIGVDGCRAGWFCVAIDAAGDFSYALARDAAELADRVAGAASVLIDIPIGLHEQAPAGRACDHEARRLLGRGRASSVFSPPARQTLSASDYQSALVINRQAVGLGLSRQAWGIVPKIRDIDNLLAQRAELRNLLYECHPEVCFWALNGSRAMSHNKKTDAGRHDRLALLSRHFADSQVLYRQATAEYLRHQVARDDIVDALACAVSARLGYPHYQVLPARPPRDSLGLPMQIVYAKNG
jgi:predicted RNase H-like nuclease